MEINGKSREWSCGFTGDSKLKELESENTRLKKMYAEERLRADILGKYCKKVKKQSQRQEVAKMISEARVIKGELCQVTNLKKNKYLY